MTANHTFGDWTFDPSSGDLSSKTKSVRLEPTVARLLEYFLLNQGRVISRDELTEKVWSNNIVSDDPINRCVSILRQALSTEDKQAYIETVPRKGYRAEFPAPGESAVSIPSEKESNPQRQIPMRVMAWGVLVILLSMALIYEWSDSREPTVEIPTLAVLPFADMSAEQNLQYLSEGISDTLIHMLSRVNKLDVTARTSSFAYKNENITIGKIADELGVSYILEGSVQIQGNKVRVLARLVDTESQREIWSNNFRRDLDDVFYIQDEIARELVIALKGTVFESKDSYKPTFETYQLVLKGIAELDTMNSDRMEQAEEYFRQAIASEPDYPQPYVLLATTLKAEFDTNSYTHIYPSEAQLANLQDVRDLIEKALDLDPVNSAAHNLRAMMLLRDGNVQEAKETLLTSIELEPNNANAIADYAALLQQMGQLDLAVVQARRAVALNPKSSRINQVLAQNLWTAGRAEEAQQVIKQDAKQRPKSANNYSLLARWSLQLGEPGKAMLYAMKERDLDPNNPNRQWGVCLMHFQLWDIEQGRSCAQSLLERFGHYYEAKSALAAFSDDRDTNIILDQIALYPNSPYYRQQLANWYVDTSRFQDALDILKPVFPSLFSETPRINDWSLWATKLIAMSWQGLDKHERARKLLNAALEHVDKSRKLQGGGFSSGVDDVYFLALLGDYDEALNRLQQAIDNNWSMYSMTIAHEPTLEPVKDDPRFIQMIEQHRQFMQQQRAWYKQQLENQSLATQS